MINPGMTQRRRHGHWLGRIAALLLLGAAAFAVQAQEAAVMKRAADLRDKRRILKSIPIVTVPMGAAYLGVNESDLHSLKYTCCDLFGARYLGRQCYSIDELQLIAKNPKWMHQYASAKPQEVAELPNLTVLDHVIFVNCDLAMAYTDLTSCQLASQVRPAYRNSCPYRLADLEKIRTAALILEGTTPLQKAVSQIGKFNKGNVQ